jgi:hypothetical protein
MLIFLVFLQAIYAAEKGYLDGWFPSLDCWRPLNEPYICPEPLALAAGYSISYYWCQAWTDGNLALMNSGIFSPNATAIFVTYNWDTHQCVSTGVDQWEMGMIPLLYNRTRCSTFTPTSITKDDLNRVAVYADVVGWRYDRPTYDFVSLVLEPPNRFRRGCGYKISYLQYIDSLCVS